MELFYDVIRKRRSVRRFEPGKKISKKALKRIVDCGRWSPSGANTQCFDFLVIEQKETLKKVTSIFLNQAQRLVDHAKGFPAVNKRPTIKPHIAPIIGNL